MTLEAKQCCLTHCSWRLELSFTGRFWQPWSEPEMLRKVVVKAKGAILGCTWTSEAPINRKGNAHL